MELHLMRPEWLWTLLPAFILILLLWRQQSRRGSWQNVIAPELLRHLVNDNTASRGSNKLPLVFLGWLLAALAASGPSWEKIPQPVHQKQDALVVLLDLSYSMKSADLAPSRVERARQKLLDMLHQRKEGQTALVAYAGDAHIVTPLTDDTPTIANLLPALHPDMMPMPGSDPVSAVTQGLNLLRSAGIRRGEILLVTDGVSDKDRKGIENMMAGSDSTLNILGVGTPTGAPIPLPSGGFLKDESGAIVMPGLDEQNLRKLANANGGSYRRLQIDDSDLDALLEDTALSETEETLALDRTADVWEDQGYILILFLLPLALALFRRGWLLTLLPLFLIAPSQPASAQTWENLWLTPDQQGQRALQEGDNASAASLFKNSEWAGTAAYRSEDYESAVEYFQNSESADSVYNRGNALAKAGQLEEAIVAYEESLQQKPDRQDAQENLELLKKLKEQQQNQEQQQDQDQQQDQNQQQDQDQNQQQDQSQQQNDDSQSQTQNEKESKEEEQEEGTTDAEPGEEETGKDQEAQQAQADSADAERDQAMEQWLRRVPDDPSGLLREKFRYESRQRQQQGVRRDDEIYW